MERKRVSRMVLVLGLSVLIALMGTAITPAFSPSVLAATPIIYVRIDGNDTTCNGAFDAGAGSAPNCAVATIQKGIDLVDPSGTVFVRAGTYVLTAVVNVNKAGITLDGDGAGTTIVQVSGTGDRFNITAAGVTIQDFEIVKTDKTGEQNIIHLTDGNNATIKNNTIHGQFVIGDGEVSRALIFNAGAFSGVNIEGNTIYALRQPAYISGTHTGTIQNNYVYGTKGWVLEGGNLTFTGNTWGTGANANVYDIAILALAGAGPYPDIVAMSNANNGAVIEDQRVSPAVLSVVYVDASTAYSTDLGGRYHPYSSIAPAVTRVVAGGTINVATGTYDEDVNLTKSLSLLGAGAGSTIIRGVIGGAGTTVQVNASNVTIAGFTITRLGNNTTDWNNPGLNSAGIAVQGTGFTGMLVRDNTLTGNRTGIDINDSSGHTIRNNVITDNRTGMILRNQTDNLTVVENKITNNWTVGIVFLDASSGSNVPVQTALNSTFSNNNFSGNWYGQIVERQTGGALPLPGTTNLKNFSGNWLGTTAPVVSTANSTEPGYAAQIPVAYGGTAVPPITPQPDILGPASANIDFTPYLNSGTDTNVETTPGRGTYGFQGDFSNLWVTAAGAQTGAIGRVQEGINMVSGSTVNVTAGTYVEDLVIDEDVTLLGPNAGINPNTGTRVAEAVILPAVSAPNPAVCEVMVLIKVSDVTIKGFTFDGDNPGLTSGIIIDGADVDACEILAGYEGMGNIVVENNILKHSTYSGIDFYNNTNPAATAGNYIRYNRFEDIGETTYNWGMGILIYNNFYADITDNVMTGVRTGVQTGNYYNANPGTTGSISNNLIGVWRLGIFHNLAYSSASPFTISGNTITAETYPGATKWNGLLLSSIGGTVNATITNNNIVIPGAVSFAPPNYTAGYNVWNVTTTAPIAISGGTITGGDYGVFVNNYEGYASNADNTAIKIDGVTVLGSAIAGVYVKDSPSNTNGATVYANIQNCTLDTNATGILVEGADATAKAYHDKIAGNPTAGVTNTSGVLMDAENNWWGAVSGPGSVGIGAGDKVSTNVDYTPWCNEDFSICGYTAATMTPTTGDALFCVGQNTEVAIDIATVANLYGYQFEVTYDATKASAVGAFVNSFFDTTGASIPGGWNAACSAGTCRFSAAKQGAGGAVTGGGTLAKITFTGVAPGTFPVTIGSGADLTDIDGELLARTLNGPLSMTVCGWTTVSGKVTMQGRSGNNVNTGTVTLNEVGSDFPGYSPAVATFSATDGAFSFTNVPVMPGGSSYKMDAAHGLYLTNSKTEALTSGVTLANQNTRLWGGDANNSGKVEIGDLSCIGASFGATPPGTCTGGSADINADGRVNVQDLAIAGGNFDKESPQTW